MSNSAAATVARRTSRRRGRRITIAQVVVIAVLTLGAFGMVAPFLWMFTTSLKSSANLFQMPPNWLPREFNFENYVAAVSGPLPILRNLFNSIFIATLGTIGILITAPMAGYAFARLRFRGQNTIFVTLLAALMIPVQVTIIPLFLIMSNLNLMDTPWSLILPAATWPLGVFLMRQFFLSVPESLLEAARIDGAGPWATYWRVALPLVKNGLSALTIISFLNNPFLWNAYFAPSIFLNSQDTATLPLALVLMRGPFSTGQMNVIMAATTIAIIPALVVFLIAQRRIIEGLTQTGIKG